MPYITQQGVRTMNRHVAPEKAVATPGKSRAPKNSTRAGAVRTNRIEARISPDGLAIVKRAAEIEGRSVSDFVVAAAREAAQKTIERTQIIRLSVEDQRRFAEAILAPSEPGPALKRARDAHRRLVRESR
jgi:uncharacterized protein (DUF1778 family)